MTIPKEITDKYGLTEYTESIEWLTKFFDSTEDKVTYDESSTEDRQLIDYRNDAFDKLQELKTNQVQELTEQLQLVTDALLEMADQVYEQVYMVYWVYLGWFLGGSWVVLSNNLVTNLVNDLLSF